MNNSVVCFSRFAVVITQENSLPSLLIHILVLILFRFLLVSHSSFSCLCGNGKKWVNEFLRPRCTPAPALASLSSFSLFRPPAYLSSSPLHPPPYRRPLLVLLIHIVSPIPLLFLLFSQFSFSYTKLSSSLCSSRSFLFVNLFLPPILVFSSLFSSNSSSFFSTSFIPYALRLSPWHLPFPNNPSQTS